MWTDHSDTLGFLYLSMALRHPQQDIALYNLHWILVGARQDRQMPFRCQSTGLKTA